MLAFRFPPAQVTSPGNCNGPWTSKPANDPNGLHARLAGLRAAIVGRS